MPDFIPADEGQFTDFSENLTTEVGENAGAAGVSAPQVTDLTAKFQSWVAARADFNAAKTAYDAAATAKVEARDALTSTIRALVGQMQKFAGMTDELRRKFRITIAKERGVIAAPDSFPTLTVHNMSRLRHEIEFRDSLTPDSKAKPDGVLGCQLFLQIGGEAPVDGAAMQFLALDTKIPYTHDNPASDLGKPVHYCARWQNAKGETGPWGPIASATVVA
ncbi:MAG TPA: hypothetical protein VF627_11520 [Abditibacterium sp.]|jgi:hypothetical protein